MRSDLISECLQLHKAIKNDPQNYTAFTELGGCLSQLYSFEEAKFYLLKAVKINPHFYRSHLLLGLLHLKTLNIKCIEQFRNLSISDPLDPIVYYLLACALVAFKGDMDQAIRSCKKAIEVGGYNSLAYTQLGIILFSEKNQRQEGIKNCLKSLEMEQKGLSALFTHRALGYMYMQCHKFEEAIASYSKLIELQNRVDFVHYQLGMAYAYLQKYRQAEQQLEKAVQNWPHWAFYFNLALAYAANRKPRKAKHCLRKVIDLSPKNQKAYFYLAILLEQERKFEEAAQCYRTAIYISPKSPHAFRRLAFLLRHKQKVEAVYCFKKAIELSLEYSQKNNTLETFAGHLLAPEQISRRRWLVQRSITQARFYYSLGSSFYELQKEQEALVCFQESIWFAEQALKLFARCDFAQFMARHKIES